MNDVNTAKAVKGVAFMYLTKAVTKLKHLSAKPSVFFARKNATLAPFCALIMKKTEEN